MSLYRVEAQYHDLTGSTTVDPSRIPSYPINDALRSVAGRNIAGAAWDYLAAKQAQAAQAMNRGEQIRVLSVATGIPEGHLHAAVPLGDPGQMPMPSPANRALLDAQAARDAQTARDAAEEQRRQSAMDMIRRIREQHHHGPQATGGYQPPFHPALPVVQGGQIPATHGPPPPVVGGVASAADSAMPQFDIDPREILFDVVGMEETLISDVVAKLERTRWQEHVAQT
jgi:hypothetical protein